ncbi:GNAT family N-acetyltransferase [Jeotgalibacillus terrae]|uniref:GNAT family N-acetyltransferase n=1 Tax=Jeotgalibacillus terrae TaxID=587735 RepID=A0ABW5ZIB0_9BACL|nr:GNAT family protein [Jeotgalibacillus terrae]MBM7578651.1 UDP-4-amino-4,6-dideoxy-N-acetyl-beta-L-altrosamine N-acetyltransferase [Jeotgalibacillus terrae]
MFSTDRMTLRKVTEEDTEIYHSWRNNPEVMKNTSPSMDQYTKADTAAFIQMISGASDAKSYMIELKETSQPIGIISLIHIDYKNRHAECVIDLGEQKQWGKGFGREAMQLLLAYAFEELNLHKVYLRVFSFNERAVRLYKKLGFEIEGEQRDQLFRDGDWHSVILMGIFQETFLRES